MEDTLVKVGMRELLSPFVQIEAQHEVRLPCQFVDVLVASQAQDPEALWRSLGWLGRMAASVCLLEAFSALLDEADAMACVRKQLAVHHERELEANRGREAGQPAIRMPVPPLWLLVWKSPETLLRSWKMTPAEGWPAGFHEGGLGALRVFVVVLDQLAVEPELIPLKLFGNAFTRWYALRQLRELPREHPIPLLFWWSIYLKQQPEDEETRRFKMELAQLVEQERKRMMEEIRQEAMRLVQQDLQAKLEQGQQDLQAKLEQGQQDLQAKLEQGQQDLQAKLEQGQQDLQAKLEQGQQDLQAKLELERQQLLVEGEAEGKAKAVVAVLEARGLTVAEAVREEILACQEPERLAAWLRVVATVASASELLRLPGIPDEKAPTRLPTGQLSPAAGPSPT